MMNDNRRPSTADRRSATPDLALHIGELALTGFADIDGAGVGAVVQEELMRLFAERGVPASLQNEVTVPALEGDDIQMDAGMRDDELGARIAEIVYGSLTR